LSPALDRRHDVIGLGVEHEMIEARVLLLDIEIDHHGAGADGIVALDLFLHSLGIGAAESSHDDPHAEVHCRAHAHADDLRQIAKESRGAPAPDQERACLMRNRD
jgi:hypothetical protein